MSLFGKTPLHQRQLAPVKRNKVYDPDRDDGFTGKKFKQADMERANREHERRNERNNNANSIKSKMMPPPNMTPGLSGLRTTATTPGFSRSATPGFVPGTPSLGNMDSIRTTWSAKTMRFEKTVSSVLDVAEETMFSLGESQMMTNNNNNSSATANGKTPRGLLPGRSGTRNLNTFDAPSSSDGGMEKLVKEKREKGDRVVHRGGSGFFAPAIVRVTAPFLDHMTPRVGSSSPRREVSKGQGSIFDLNNVNNFGDNPNPLSSSAQLTLKEPDQQTHDNGQNTAKRFDHLSPRTRKKRAGILGQKSLEALDKIHEEREKKKNGHEVVDPLQTRGGSLKERTGLAFSSKDTLEAQAEDDADDDGNNTRGRKRQQTNHSGSSPKRQQSSSPKRQKTTDKRGSDTNNSTGGGKSDELAGIVAEDAEGQKPTTTGMKRGPYKKRANSGSPKAKKGETLRKTNKDAPSSDPNEDVDPKHQHTIKPSLSSEILADMKSANDIAPRRRQQESPKTPSKFGLLKSRSHEQLVTGDLGQRKSGVPKTSDESGNNSNGRIIERVGANSPRYEHILKKSTSKEILASANNNNNAVLSGSKAKELQERMKALQEAQDSAKLEQLRIQEEREMLKKALKDEGVNVSSPENLSPRTSKDAPGKTNNNNKNKTPKVLAKKNKTNNNNNNKAGVTLASDEDLKKHVVFSEQASQVDSPGPSASMGGRAELLELVEDDELNPNGALFRQYKYNQGAVNSATTAFSNNANNSQPLSSAALSQLQKKDRQEKVEDHLGVTKESIAGVLSFKQQQEAERIQNLEKAEKEKEANRWAYRRYESSMNDEKGGPKGTFMDKVTKNILQRQNSDSAVLHGNSNGVVEQKRASTIAATSNPTKVKLSLENVVKGELLQDVHKVARREEKLRQEQRKKAQEDQILRRHELENNYTGLDVRKKKSADNTTHQKREPIDEWAERMEVGPNSKRQKTVERAKSQEKGWNKVVKKTAGAPPQQSTSSAANSVIDDSLLDGTGALVRHDPLANDPSGTKGTNINDFLGAKTFIQKQTPRDTPEIRAHTNLPVEKKNSATNQRAISRTSSVNSQHQVDQGSPGRQAMKWPVQTSVFSPPLRSQAQLATERINAQMMRVEKLGSIGVKSPLKKNAGAPTTNKVTLGLGSNKAFLSELMSPERRKIIDASEKAENLKRAGSLDNIQVLGHTKSEAKKGAMGRSDSYYDSPKARAREQKQRETQEKKLAQLHEETEAKKAELDRLRKQRPAKSIFGKMVKMTAAEEEKVEALRVAVKASLKKTLVPQWADILERKCFQICFQISNLPLSQKVLAGNIVSGKISASSGLHGNTKTGLLNLGETAALGNPVEAAQRGHSIHTGAGSSSTGALGEISGPLAFGTNAHKVSQSLMKHQLGGLVDASPGLVPHQSPFHMGEQERKKREKEAEMKQKHKIEHMISDYRMKTRSLYANLRQDKCVGFLREELEKGTIKAIGDIAALPPEKLVPEKQTDDNISLGLNPFFMRDETLKCPNCPQDTEVLYMHKVIIQDTTARGDYWQSKEDMMNIDRAQCQTCKFEWDFEAF